MLIITSLAAAAIAVSSAAAASTPSAPPPMAVAVVTLSEVAPTLVSRVLEEASEVWRPTGLTFVWRHVSRAEFTRLDLHPPDCPDQLRITIGDSRGRAGGTHESLVALGWIDFDEDGPAPQIYLSYQNALAFMAGSSGVTGPLLNMPPLEREMKLARAMGRALAHELGHYLLASKVHTPRGLMQGTHTASEFFEYSRQAFAIDKGQRQALVARLSQATAVVRR
ncbi:MAG TPA: hypothetical protein VKD69_21460 [Vicinamibacterales bacterium]|nr:hypothetical protein [Vicinamibacterales bacterium]